MFLAETFEQPQIAADALGAALTERLIALGKGLTQNGQPLTKRDALRPYTQTLAATFLESTLPQWRELGICD